MGTSPHPGRTRSGLGHTIAKTTVWQILTHNDIEPSPTRSDVTWSKFLHSQAAVACDFFTVDTAVLRCYNVLFFIKAQTREVPFACLTANPGGGATERPVFTLRRQSFVHGRGSHHRMHRRSTDRQC